VTNGSGVSGNPTLELSTTGVTADSYGSASSIPTFTVDAYGRLTTVSDVDINILTSQIIDFTEDVQDIVGSTITAGTGVTVSYNDLTGAVTITATGATNEAIDDRVAALLVAGTGITLTYNDVANTLTIASTVSGGGNVTGAGSPFQVAYWSGTTAIDGDNNLLWDGVSLAVNQTTIPANVVLSTTGMDSLSTGIGYLHHDSTGTPVYFITNDGTAHFGAGLDPLTVSISGMDKGSSYYFSTGSGNIRFIPAGIVHMDSPVGINTTSVGSNQLRVVGGVQFDLGSDTSYDLYRRSTSGSLERIPLGSNGDVLSVVSGVPAWAPAGSASLPAGSSGSILMHNGTAYTSVSRISETQTGITGATVTLASTPLSYAPVDVYRNGALQIVTDDYTRSGATLTMSPALVATEKVTAIYYI
jgi:hypothetical protein